MIKLLRVYDINEKDESGYTILIDRLWPRGVKKSDLKANEWLKEAAPSNSLRKWFGHDPEKWNEFRKEYKKELKQKTDLLRRIKAIEKKYGTIILLLAAKDTKHNHGLVLKEVLDKFE